MDESQLIERLRRVENLFAGAATQGEREAAANALERIRRRLADVQRSDPPTEQKFRLTDVWSRRLLLALLRRYGIRPYRYAGQRQTTERVIRESLEADSSEAEERRGLPGPDP